MATTVALKNIPTSGAIAHNLLGLDTSQMSQQSLRGTPDGRSIDSHYLFTGGNLEDTTSSHSRYTVNPKTGQITNSWNLTTRQVVTVDGVITEDAPWKGLIQVETPGVVYDILDLSRFMQCLVSLAFNGVTSGVPNTARLVKYQRGLIGQLY